MPTMPPWIFDAFAFLEGFIEILLDVRNDAGFDDHQAAFKMEHQGTVIEVESPDRRDFPIDQEHLLMDEAGSVFIDLDPCFDQIAVIGTGNLEYGRLIGDMGDQ